MTAPDPRDWLAKRAELEGAATVGPWFASKEPFGYDDDETHIMYRRPLGDGSYGAVGKVVENVGDLPLLGDIDWIADARTSAPAMRKALEAVLGLHRENTPEDGYCQGYTDTGYGYLDSWCVECSEQSGREYGTNFPCATNAAITDALEDTP